jgi:hypothetical protein
LLMKTFKKITDCRAAFFSAPRFSWQLLYQYKISL